MATLALTRGQPLLEALVVSTLLPVEAFGTWSWALILWGLAVSLTHFGLPAATLRYSALPGLDKAQLLGYVLYQSRWSLLAATSLYGILSWTIPWGVRRLCWFLFPLLWTQQIGEILRSFLRGQYINAAVARWQGAYSLLTLASLSVGAALGGLSGAIWGKALQAVWQVILAIWLLPLPRPVRARPIAGFWRFAWRAYWGNLAHDLLFYLPGALLGWRVRNPIPVAYWRWATLIPLNLRQLATYFILYLYPKWVADPAPARVLYQRYRPYVWLGSLAVYGAGALWVFLWDFFPGEAYAPAKGPYLLATGVGFLWSTEAVLLPNLLSAKGDIGAYTQSYLLGFLVAVSILGWAGTNLYLYLIGLGLAGLVSAAVSLYRLRRH